MFHYKNKPYGLLFLALVYCFNVSAKEPSAQRIIALSPHSVEILFALGVGDRIVATLEYADYPQAAKKIPRVGNFSGIKIEKILALKPDLVIAWKGGNKASDLEKIESLGMNLFYSHPKNVNQVIEEILALGRLTGTQNVARNLAKKLSKQYRTIKNSYSDKSKIKVFYQLWHKPLRTIGGDNWLNSLISDCGGKNIFEKAKAPYPAVSFESVVMAMPEVIIIPDNSKNFTHKAKLWSAWPEITAVNKDQIFSLDGDLLQRFTPRAIEGLRQLCKSIDQARDSLTNRQ
ncbi:MAG: cobalamin-binding protein [Enterobacterales bacterium]|nr:cobalamin-binding protein [Enterobacterales bacterium]